MSVARAEALALLSELSISVHFEQVSFAKLCRNIAIILKERGKLEVKMMIAPDTDMHRVTVLKEQLRQIEGIERARVIMSPMRDPATNELMGYTDKQKQEFGDVQL